MVRTRAHLQSVYLQNAHCVGLILMGFLMGKLITRTQFADLQPVTHSNQK